MESFWEMAKKQGFTVVFLLFIAWLLYQKMEKLENLWQGCQNEKLQIVQSLVNASNRVIEENTRAFDRNTAVMEAIMEAKGIKAPRKMKMITGRGGERGLPEDDN